MVLMAMNPTDEKQTVFTHTEWNAEGRRRFGDDQMKWRFKCPSCGCVATPEAWKSAGAKETHVAYSCVGRWTGSTKEIFDKTGGPCNYAGGGLFGLNPITVTDGEKKWNCFAFADEGV